MINYQVNAMAEKIIKKRKLSDGTASDAPIDVDKYAFSPIRLKTLQQNLESIPKDVLVRTLISLVNQDLSFIVKLNEEIPANIETISEPIPTHFDPHLPILSNDQDHTNTFETLQYDHKKIKAYIDILFRRHTYHSRSKSVLAHFLELKNLLDNGLYNELQVENHVNYNHLIDGLEKMIARARLLYEIGETVSAYIILRVMAEEIDENRIINNGNYDEEAMDTPARAIPFDVNAFLAEIMPKLSEEERKYCKDKMPMYEDQKPSEENNTFAVTNFPFDIQHVLKKYEAAYLKSSPYMGQYKLKSLISPIGTENHYTVIATVPAVNKNHGLYKQELHYNTKALISYKCSCITGHTFCKHLAGLAGHICNEKHKLLAYMKGATVVQAKVTSTRPIRHTAVSNSNNNQITTGIPVRSAPIASYIHRTNPSTITRVVRQEQHQFEAPMPKREVRQSTLQSRRSRRRRWW